MILISPKYPVTNQNSTILKEAEMKQFFHSCPMNILFSFLFLQDTVNAEGKILLFKAFTTKQ